MSRALEIAQARAAQAEANRAAFHFATQMVDELRAAGFEGARVTYAAEGERTVGTRGAVGVQLTPAWTPAKRRGRRE